MLTKQELEILDNAPEGATHYMTRKGDVDYSILSNDVHKVAKEPRVHFLSEWKATPLADLRKKQGKTVVDAVNYYRGEQEYDAFLLDGEFTTNSRIARESGGHRICMITEFNQCVEEMSKGDCEARWGLYKILHKQLLTKENSDYSFYEQAKPRTKVEYVKAHFSKLSDAFRGHEKSPLYICDRGEYHKANGLWIYNIVEAGGWFSLYRKVENEITWQDEAKELLIPATRQYKHNNGIGFLCGYDCDETVRIVADLIEKLHPVTSLTKQQPQKEGK